METAYLKECFGNSLTQALAEVARVRPSDPIEYLAHLLYHYRDVKNAKGKKEQELLQLKEEHDRSLKEEKTTQVLKQEKNQIQQKCEKCHQVERKEEWETELSCCQELHPKAVSSSKTPSLQEDTTPLEETLSQVSPGWLQKCINRFLPLKKMTCKGSFHLSYDCRV
ncbi:Dydc2 [Phodopus roborovskii]|uniref:Dydc2 protein n=1 Tax=Phodopus roborovskii TaxID=109678 RepID=A0AAV0A6Z0_PHORO|nr:Dydc2 [Phodopus roborovskii]